MPRAHDARRHWLAFVPRIRSSRRALILFEVWNLLVIVASLVGFNFVRAWAGAPGLSCAVWNIAALTAAITVGAVWVWTRGVEA